MPTPGGQERGLLAPRAREGVKVDVGSALSSGRRGRGPPGQCTSGGHGPVRSHTPRRWAGETRAGRAAPPGLGRP